MTLEDPTHPNPVAGPVSVQLMLAVGNYVGWERDDSLAVAMVISGYTLAGKSAGFIIFYLLFEHVSWRFAAGDARSQRLCSG